MNEAKDLVERLRKYPKLAQRFEALLDIVESDDRDLFNAHHAEAATVAKVQQLGHQVIQDWAETKEKVLSEEASEQVGPVKRHGKKNFNG